jgi:hypothetical protein
MTHKALRRPGHLGRPTTRLIPSRPLRRDLERARPALGAGRLIGRWRVGEDGRLVRGWEVERPPGFPVDRKRGSDA